MWFEESVFYQLYPLTLCGAPAVNAPVSGSAQASGHGRGGIGRLAVQAISGRDIPLLEGTALFATAVVILGNLIADMLYAVLDPRVGRREGLE